jgi:hypothetical protein
MVLRCRCLQGDAALRGWETSFAATYGPLLGLEAETLLDKSVETVLDLMSEKGILRPASARKISDFQRVCATGKWTCAAAVGGDVSFGRSDCMWPLTGAKPSPEPRQPIHAGSGGRVYQPRQAKNQHTLLAGVHQGNSPQQKHSTLRPAELDDERMSLLEGVLVCVRVRVCLLKGPVSKCLCVFVCLCVCVCVCVCVKEVHQ